MLKKLKEKAKQITQNLSILYIAYKRKDVPIFAKIIIIAAIIYALSPIDLIPDFIPVLGYLDDLIILPLLIYVSIMNPRSRAPGYLRFLLEIFAYVGEQSPTPPVFRSRAAGY
jgi:uncharacterized membrane protein YkvA (DUF1232 family)